MLSETNLTDKYHLIALTSGRLRIKTTTKKLEIMRTKW